MALSRWLNILLGRYWRSQSALKSSLRLAPWLNRNRDELWDSGVKIYKHFSKLFFQACFATFGPVLSLVIPTLTQIASCIFGFKWTDDLILMIFIASSFLQHEEAIGCKGFFSYRGSLCIAEEKYKEDIGYVFRWHWWISSHRKWR